MLSRNRGDNLILQRGAQEKNLHRTALKRLGLGAAHYHTFVCIVCTPPPYIVKKEGDR